MSESSRSRGQPGRTARVWQPSDLLLAVGADKRFVPRRWQAEALRRFEPSPEPITVHGPGQTAEPSEESAPESQVPLHEEMAGMPEPSAPPEGTVNLEALEEARLQAYAQGQEQAREDMRRQMEQEREDAARALRERVAALEAAVESLRQSPEQLHEPLKRLALHLAEQLVLGELNHSPQAVERLVRRCVDELAGPRNAPVRVDLNPQDLALLQPWLARTTATDAEEGAGPLAWQLQPDEGLRPGSVRVSASDAVVTDLIEHRLEALARQLLVDPLRASRQSAFQPERLAARSADVDVVLDAQPRMAEPGRGSRFGAVVDAEPAESPDSAQPPEALGDESKPGQDPGEEPLA